MKQKTQPILSKLIQSFFHERLANQLRASENTVVSYRDTLKMFLLFASERTGKAPVALDVDDMSVECILAFLNHLENARQNNTRTRNQRLAAIKAFFHYVAFLSPEHVSHCRRVLEIPAKRYCRPMFEHLTKEEVSALQAVPDRSTWTGRRDYALLMFMYNTGARVSETINATADQLHFSRPYQVVLHGKGGKTRVVPLWQKTADVLLQWRDEPCPHQRTRHSFFINAQGEKLTRGGVAHILRMNVEKASEMCPSLLGKRVSPHTLRHTTAMHLLMSGADIESIRSWLGHVSLDTTHQYAEADLEMKRKTLEKGGITAPEPAGFACWQPTDDIIAFLDTL